MEIHRKLREMHVRARDLRTGDFVVSVRACVVSIRKGHSREMQESAPVINGHVMCKFPPSGSRNHTGASFHPDSLIHIYR